MTMRFPAFAERLSRNNRRGWDTEKRGHYLDKAYIVYEIRSSQIRAASGECNFYWKILQNVVKC